MEFRSEISPLSRYGGADPDWADPDRIAQDRVERELERGTTMIEYLLLIGLVTLICIGAMQVVGLRVSQRFSLFSSQLDTAS